MRLITGARAPRGRPRRLGLLFRGVKGGEWIKSTWVGGIKA
jgi:hypothetical protein